MQQRIAWLKAGSAITLLTGLLIAAAAIPALSGPTLWFFDLVIFPLDGAQSLAGTEQRLLCAITGGLLGGLAVLMWLVTTEVFAAHPALGRSLILKSIVTWFVIDSSMSIAAGAPWNVVGNIGFLLIFTLPVLTVTSVHEQTA
ncbi:MAG: excinuclease ABC subunit A [Pseudomonadota bacterium]